MTCDIPFILKVYSMNPTAPQAPYSYAYVQQAQQIQRHEVARMQQFVYDLEKHVNDLHRHAAYLGQTISTQEESLEYSSLLLKLNQTINSLESHRETLNQMLLLANVSFGKNIPDQSRREIYHYYHAGRYSQAELARQYGISQSAVSKIVNSQAPEPIGSVNPNGIAKS